MSAPWLDIQTILRAKGYGLGASGPNRDGVDGNPGDLTAAAILAELMKGSDRAAAPVSHCLAKPDAFFATLRASGLFVAGLDQKQVDGINTILTACGEAGWPIAYTAYAIATAYHETAQKFEPVREAFWKTEQWRKDNLRYFPHYGRGFVQLTWPKNYQRADDELGLDGKLVASLDLAMDPAIAAKVMVRGMEQGWFTERKLADTLPTNRPPTFEEFKASRPDHQRPR
jgi:putative chitinase